MPEVKITEKKPQQPEGKTLFEHMGLTGSKDGKPNESMERMKKLLISCCVFMVIGYVCGLMLDIMLGTSYYSMILALALLLIWIIRVFGPYLKIK